MDKIDIKICCFALLLMTSCHHKAKRESMPPLAIEVAEAQLRDIYDEIEVASEVASLYEVTIQPRVDGFLLSKSFEEGMPIRRGDRLFTIDSDQFNIALLSAQAALESAQAQELLAHNNYHRAVPLANIDAISQSDLDQYRATHSAAIASVKSAREALKRAELNLSYTQISAPIDGLIANSSANEGDYITPENILTTISYIDTVEVEIPIPTAIYLRNRVGESYDNLDLLSNISMTLSGGESYEYLGEYHYTIKNTPLASSAVVVVAKFPNPDLRLKSGMFARVRANIGSVKPRVVVPQRAVSQMQGVNSLWVISPDSVAEFREVTLGGTHGEDWVIESGVESGESVVTSGQLKVHKGAKVVPVKR